jgi:hypothetical protein
MAAGIDLCPQPVAAALEHPVVPAADQMEMLVRLLHATLASVSERLDTQARQPANQGMLRHGLTG